MRLSATALIVVSLVACGGGANEGAFEHAVEQAAAKEAEARALGADTPCTEQAQCSYLTFQSPYGACGDWRYKPYSLTSPTAAAASAAAVSQNELARRAIALAPPSDTLCPAVVAPPPSVSCIASTCRAN
jgi:hypothetical protein